MSALKDTYVEGCGLYDRLAAQRPVFSELATLLENLQGFGEAVAGHSSKQSLEKRGYIKYSGYLPQHAEPGKPEHHFDGFCIGDKFVYTRASRLCHRVLSAIDEIGKDQAGLIPMDAACAIPPESQYSLTSIDAMLEEQIKPLLEFLSESDDLDLRPFRERARNLHTHLQATDYRLFSEADAKTLIAWDAQRQSWHPDMLDKTLHAKEQAIFAARHEARLLDARLNGQPSPSEIEEIRAANGQRLDRIAAADERLAQETANIERLRAMLAEREAPECTQHQLRIARDRGARTAATVSA